MPHVIRIEMIDSSRRVIEDVNRRREEKIRTALSSPSKALSLMRKSGKKREEGDDEQEEVEREREREREREKRERKNERNRKKNSKRELNKNIKETETPCHCPSSFFCSEVSFDYFLALLLHFYFAFTPS